VDGIFTVKAGNGCHPLKGENQIQKGRVSIELFELI
jgi:hypothetical protein